MIFPGSTADEKGTSADDSPAGANILEPLQLLLAARRGVRTDPTFADSNIPDDRYISFSGASGVSNISNHLSLWARFLCYFGYAYAPNKILRGAPDGSTPFLPATLTLIPCMTYENHFMSEEQKQESPWFALKMAGYVFFLTIPFMIIARIFSKRYMAAVIPPQFNPLSYQAVVAQVMQRRGLHYREMMTAPLKDMGKLWKTDRGLVERFRIEGLVDPEGPWVYDVAVKFWKNEQLMLQFAGSEGKVCNKQSGLLLQPNTEKA